MTTLLDVPLIDSPRTTLTEIQNEQRTLESPGTDRELARKELTESPLYRNLVVSPDGRTTAMQVNFRRDEQFRSLLERRESLRLTQSERELTPEELAELETVSAKFKAHSAELQDLEQRGHRRRADHPGESPGHGGDPFGGHPHDHLRHDRLCAQRHPGIRCRRRPVSDQPAGGGLQAPALGLDPMLICVAAAIGMVGYLGLMDWRVTVVSSNFISLMLITALALTVHLMVRYLELQTQSPDGDQRAMVQETIRSKFLPSLYTALTTQVAFASLIISGIRPVIDFGWMMVAGVGLAFVLCFLLFPAATVRLKPGKPVFRHHDVTAAITRSLARVIERFRTPTLVIYALLVALSVAGVFRLTVENRFIDYFKESTEIYQGMVLIDQQLGGTTPLDVVVDPDRSFLEMLEEEPIEEAGADEFEDDPLYEDALAEGETAGISGDSYWFNMFQLADADKIHAYLDGLPETGKVLSISTTMALVTMLNNDEPMDNFTLAVLHNRLPDAILKTLFAPYMSEDGNQLRFSIRVIDSDPGLKRDELIKRIRTDLVDNLGLEDEQVHLSGMLVLYNNVLQSLFRSQILTLAVVFLAIGMMLLILFRNWKLAAIGTVPTMAAATAILGTMGWLGIPLDIMTITIAAITIGIGVDNTIHYVHRVREELAVDGDYWAAVERSHGSVGRAIYYTSVTVSLGFSILVLSNFIPTIYFGLLTGLAMLIALIANLTLLPLLIVTFKPLGPGAG